MEYIYLFKLKNADMVYKVGRTSRDIIQRAKEYRAMNQIQIVSVWMCENSIKSEYKILKMMDEEFIRVHELGREYYFGDARTMQYKISNIIMKDTDKIYTKKINIDEKIADNADLINTKKLNKYYRATNIDMDIDNNIDINTDNKCKCCIL